jgi:hypothetical protein
MDLTLLCRRQAKAYGKSRTIQAESTLWAAGEYGDWLSTLLCHENPSHEVTSSRLQIQKRTLATH